MVKKAYSTVARKLHKLAGSKKQDDVIAYLKSQFQKPQRLDAIDVIRKDGGKEVGGEGGKGGGGDPPRSAELLDRAAVLRHQREALEQGVLPIMRSRVMITGQGRVGKTTFVNRCLGKPFNPNEKSTVGAKTQDVDAKNVREQEGVDISQAETADGCSALANDDADDEHVRALRKEVARLAQKRKGLEEEAAARAKEEAAKPKPPRPSSDPASSDPTPPAITGLSPELLNYY